MDKIISGFMYCPTPTGPHESVDIRQNDKTGKYYVQISFWRSGDFRSIDDTAAVWAAVAEIEELRSHLL